MAPRLHTPTEAEILADPGAFAQFFFAVRSKEKAIVPFIFNPVQRHYWQRKTKRDIIVKARQIGFSTVMLARYLCDTIRATATDTVTVGHETKAMQRMLSNVKTMLDSVPPQYKPVSTYNNKDELYFGGIESRYYIGTFKGLGRSGKINNIHATEVAFWESAQAEERLQGYLQSVPWNGSVVLESTPYGAGGLFYRMVRAAEEGENDYRLHVYPWYLHDEYQIPRERWEDVLHPSIRPRFKGGRMILDDKEIELAGRGVTPQQIVWRRWKMRDMGDMRVGKDGCLQSRLFAQEYECAFVESGDTVFDIENIYASCEWGPPKKGHEYVHGLDTAEGVQGGNYSVSETMDRRTGEFVRQLRGRWKPADFAERCHPIYMQYGGLVVCECNNTGHAVLQRLEQLYFEAAKEILRTKKGVKTIDQAFQAMPYRIYGDNKRLGFTTNEQTKQLLISDFDSGLQGGAWKFAAQDLVGMKEARGWVWGPRMKPTAKSGEHDDTVIAKMLAAFGAKAAVWDFFFNRKPTGRAFLVSPV